MRIISGQYKGRKLLEFKGNEIRPTSDMAREAIFSIVRERIADAEVLDLFAGTGSVGIEALSRGAKRVIFCDISKDSVQLLKKNLEHISAPEDSFEIYNIPALYLLKRLRDQKRQFDMIYVDPPYKTSFGLEAIDLIGEYGLLKENGIAILEHETGDKRKFDSKFLSYIDERRYGRAMLKFYEVTK